MLTSISCVCAIFFDVECPTVVLILGPRNPRPALTVASTLNVSCNSKVPPSFVVVVSRLLLWQFDTGWPTSMLYVAFFAGP